MLWSPESSLSQGVDGDRTGILFAGPGSSLTIPGIIVSEIIQALAQTDREITRVEVDVASNFKAGLHRAPSLSTAHDQHTSDRVTSYRAPDNSRLRTQMFRDLMGREVGTAIAYAWPGIDNSWIRKFIQVANSVGTPTMVFCASLPASTTTKAVSLADIMYRADSVWVGDAADADELKTAFGSNGPVVEVQRALSLRGKSGRSTTRQITTFLPKDNVESLATMLAAFDAIPEAWIPDYRLQVVMRYSGEALPEMISRSFHADYVCLVGDNISGDELQDLCATSSALSVADPALDSRAFSSAVESGTATVVLATSPLLTVRRGYVGGLLADLRRPSSVLVALNHALRLEDLRFPEPGVWGEIARHLSSASRTGSRLNVLEPVLND